MKADCCPVCTGASIRPFTVVEGRSYFECTHCGAVWLAAEQRLPEAEEAAHYRLHENDVHDVAYRQFLSAVSIPLLEKLAGEQNGLDYGCGPGPALAAILTEAGHTVVTYDPLFANHPAVLDRQYDFVTCTEVVEHFHDPAVEFSRFNSLLKPGAWLGIMTGMLSETVDFTAWHYRRDPTHIVFYRRQTFEALAGQYGWHCEFPSRDVVLMQKPA